uniref:Uncharacterized protein n=1 Tax=Nelumbo nucifera TaxID=4432 RepID=A0A822ZB52_NELNU|nr:TPA_asm: hypothetical protein HUJ06_016106 [Nelumbo nucifera]
MWLRLWTSNLQLVNRLVAQTLSIPETDQFSPLTLARSRENDHHPSASHARFASIWVDGAYSANSYAGVGVVAFDLEDNFLAASSSSEVPRSLCFAEA